MPTLSSDGRSTWVHPTVLLQAKREGGCCSAGNGTCWLPVRATAEALDRVLRVERSSTLQLHCCARTPVSAI